MPPFSSPLSGAIRRELLALWRLTWPILVGQLATVGMAVSDTVMTGRLDARELAAVSLGVSMWSVAYLTLIGLLMPVNALVAHAHGARDPARAAAIARQALWMGLGCGLAAMLFLNMAAELFVLLPIDPAVARQGVRFVRIISFGLPALALYRALYAFSASLDQTRPMMVIALGALAFNVAANAVLIYGLWGAPRMGALGCALATAVGPWLMFAAMAAWVHRHPVYAGANPFARFEGPVRTEIVSMFKLGAPLGVAYFAEVSAFSAIAFLVAKFGVTAIAANQIAMNVMSVAFVLPLSVGIALVTRVGQALGAGDPERARFVAAIGVGMAIALGLATATLLLVARHEVAALYTHNPGVKAAAAALLVLTALMQVSDAAQVSAAAAIRGYKVTRQPMRIHLTAFWCIALPVGALLGNGWIPLPGADEPMGAAGYWLGLALGLTVAATRLWRLLDSLARQAVGDAAPTAQKVALAAAR